MSFLLSLLKHLFKENFNTISYQVVAETIEIHSAQEIKWQ
jgi:hypothetical protein